jgi:hypothetical protein
MVILVDLLLDQLQPLQRLLLAQSIEPINIIILLLNNPGLMQLELWEEIVTITTKQSELKSFISKSFMQHFIPLLVTKHLTTFLQQ